MLSKFSVKKPYAIIVFIIILAILGVVAFTSMTVDFLPNMELPYMVVVTVCPGAAPETVEKEITSPIEQAVASISNLKNVYGMSYEHYSLIVMEFNSKVNITEATQSLQSSLSLIKDSFPELTMEPFFMKVNPSMIPIMSIAVYENNTNIADSSPYLESVASSVKSVEGAASISASGLVNNMLLLTMSNEKFSTVFSPTNIAGKINRGEITQEDLTTLTTVFNSLNTGNEENQENFDLSSIGEFLTPSLVSMLVMAQNMSMPAGTVASESGNIVAKVGEEIKSIEELKVLPLFNLNFSSVIPLLEESGVILSQEIKDQLSTVSIVINVNDLYDVIELDNAGNQHSIVNGNSGVLLNITKQPGYSTLEVTEGIRKALDNKKEENSDFNYIVLMDQGEYVDLMINNVIYNLLYGAFFAIVVLFIFLKEIKPTLIVGVSIFISILAAFVMMYFSGITINIISMSGLALGVGMLVDNSIVVIENIYRRKSLGENGVTASIEGAKQVTGAIFASTLTTVVVFLPVIFLQGMTKQLLNDIALTITYSLLSSLFVALTIVPMATSWFIDKDKKIKYIAFEKLKNFYAKCITFSLNKKWIVIATVIILFITTTIGAFFMERIFFPTTSIGYVSLNITIDDSKIPENMSKSDVVEIIMDEAYNSAKDLKFADSVSMAIMSNNSIDISSIIGENDGSNITVYVVIDKKSKLSDLDAQKQLNEKIKNGIVSIPSDCFKIKNQSMTLDASLVSSREITVNITGENLDKIRDTSRDLAKLITDSGLIGVDENNDIKIDDGIGKPNMEYNISVDKVKASQYGLTVGQVVLGLQKALEKIDSSTTVTVEETSDKFDIYVYDLSYDLIRYYRTKDAEGKVYKIYIERELDALGFNLTDKYYAQMIGSQDKISVTKINEGFKDVNDKIYFAPSNGLTEYYDIEKELDLPLVKISNSITSSSFSDDISVDSDLIPEVTVELYKILKDESFLKDENGNVIYRKDENGLQTSIPTGIALKEGYLAINHENGMRINYITATIKDGVNSTDAINDIKKIVEKYQAPSGVNVYFAGQNELITEAYNSLIIMLMLAVLLIYLVMVAQFQSLKSPFIIMFTIPLAITGSILSLIISGQPVSIVALVGLVLLMGVVVNNGIVFVDYANQLIDSGMERKQALIQTGKDRIRPILMTALTTIAGLLTMAFDTSANGVMLKPMAISVMGGLTYATLLTLFFIPVMYDIFNKKKGLKKNDNIFEELLIIENINKKINTFLG